MELLATDVCKQKLQLNAVWKYKQSNMQELMLNQKCLATDFFVENLGNPQTRLSRDMTKVSCCSIGTHYYFSSLIAIARCISTPICFGLVFFFSVHRA